VVWAAEWAISECNLGQPIKNFEASLDNLQRGFVFLRIFGLKSVAMKRIPESQIDNEFERQYAWGDDERFYFNKNRKKSSVMGFFTRLELVLELMKKFSPGTRLPTLRVLRALLRCF
jgi:hypothetical protein